MFRKPIIGGLVLLLALLAGCSAVRFAYNQGPDLAFWWLERYIDFDDAQEPRAHEAIAAWFRWHRSTQLPDYASLLAKARSEVAEPVTAGQICHWVDEVMARLDTAYEHALPPLADMVRGLSPQQLAHLERKYEKNNKEYRKDFLQADAQERQRMQVKRIIDGAELLYGRLNDAQRDAVVQWSADSPFDPELWYVERQRRQQGAVQALRRMAAEHSDAEEVQRVLRQLYEETFRSPRPAYRAYQQRLWQHNCAFAAQVHNLSTPEQRAQAVKRLKGWEDDARSLAVQGTR